MAKWSRLVAMLKLEATHRPQCKLQISFTFTNVTHIKPYIEYESRLHPLTFPKIGILSLKSINLRLKDVHSLS